jgi:transaldolase/glucose-6-phosphate isomerase
MKKNPLLELHHLGQSLWLDYIRRGMLVSGELERLIQEDGIKGVTSNPTIFEKAIAGSTDYNLAMQKLVSSGKGIPEIYEALVLEDIAEAADLFRPVYEASNGTDGFVSIEVSPELAYNTQGTIEEARRLFALLDRPNIMIKVPGTPLGIPAIETLIANGVNVNITLLFSLENYEQVMEAYLKGLEKRLQNGESLKKVSSVASFFVSRVDTLADKKIQEKIEKSKDPKEKEKLQSLLGKVAVANAKMAYQKFKAVFQSERFQKLKAHGANVQRPLWASTSTKNPAYSDILYVQSLIGKDTVNTVPPETLQAFKDHGDPRLTIEENLEEARHVLSDLEAFGINLKEITQKLQEEGVKAFLDSFQKLMQCIAEKREAFLGSRLDRQSASLGKDLELKVQETLQNFQKENVIKRIWEKDATLWKKTPEHERVIKERLGWLTIVESMKDAAERLHDFARAVVVDGVKDVVILGMGGSSLCPDVLRHTFGKIQGFPELHVLDTTDPASILVLEQRLDLKKTLFLVSSKSGGTLETESLFQYFYDKVQDGRSFVAITDPGTSLEETALKKNFRQIFLNPPDIGGRYSALSYFGLVPAALMGLDVRRLLDSAERMVQSCVACVPPHDNPGAVLGVILGEAYKLGRDKITFIVPKPIHTFGYWVEQLLAESTGKEGKGLVPIEGEPVGVPEVYGSDRLFVYIHLQSHHDEKLNQKVKALSVAGHPVVRITLAEPYDLGEEFFRWEFATAVAGILMQINAFDQPNVQESKDNTKEVLEAYKKTGKLPETKPLIEENGLQLFADPKEISGAKTLSEGFSRFLSFVKSGDYFAFMAYFQRTPSHDEAFANLRTYVRDNLYCATTMGYGPRFLHSTGQLHKGGANQGVFLQLTADDSQDLKIPGEAFGFSVLKQAQAFGDYQALLKHKRRVVRLHLGKDIGVGLEKLSSILKDALAVKR